MQKKPVLRGRIHQLALIISFIFLILHLLYSLFTQLHLGTLIILTTQCILYGTSSYYHLTSFKHTRTERLAQRIDHMCIFLFIASVHSSMALTLKLMHTKLILMTTWMIFVLGATKIFLVEKVVEAIDVALYIVHGMSITLFLKFESLRSVYRMVLSLGGLLYVLGGIVFGLEKPDLVPAVYGYHELFHTLTVLANVCFLIPIIMFYVSW
ncbi:hemolysin III family channel protein [Vavraia culicis subsp. floridensis]|uniref:Hemolysin III family channel protein n=1 Tax=Vavraia culicis (isolate floridensis) TaxID=948595 RepID=L2GW15_VAVCU|nr:hemolysin III family channel protein [Vavraia culicis subsp. floridensis]ELA47473.1 hemolysin III family channel protein [Vavraia culicis subsp. floridensis]